MSAWLPSWPRASPMSPTLRTMLTPGVSVGTRNIDMPWYALTSGLVTTMTIRNDDVTQLAVEWVIRESGKDEIDRLDLLGEKSVDPVELLLELGFGFEVPCHDRTLGDVRNQRPFHVGVRRSAAAFIPSTASSVP